MQMMKGGVLKADRDGPPAGMPQNRPARRTSLRLRLIALAALGLAMLIAERIGAIVNQHEEELRSVRQHVLELADRGLAQYAETLASVRSTLRVLTLDTSGMLAHPDACGRLDAVVAMEPALVSLSVVDTDGIVACSSNPAARGMDLSDREYVRIAQRGAYNLSSITRGLLSNTPNIIAAEPAIADDGTVTAIVMARIDLDTLFPLSIISALDLNAAVLMIDARGNALISYPDAQKLGGDLSHLPVIETMLSRSSGTVIGRGPDGAERIYGFRRLPGSNMRLAVGLETAQAEAPLEAATWRAAGTFTAACALIFIGMWFAGERLVVRPVRMLSARLSRFGRGEADPANAIGSEREAGEPVPQIVELQPLVSAFSAMARQLTDRELALRDLNARLRTLANVDPLTGVANRRAFDERLEVLWASGAGDLAMLMIDIDFFKQFNDRYGHGEGDDCLRRVAGALVLGVRSTDMVARLGGEEFAILMPGADEAAAGELSARLRGSIEALAIPHLGTLEGRVTVSLGYAACQAPHDDPVALLAAADRALYEAKHAGRNAVRRGDIFPAGPAGPPLLLRRG